MSTHSITHGPVPFVAAAAAIAAIAASTVVSHDSAGSEAPAKHPQTSINAHPHHKWHPTTSGGHTMIGMP
jgi:hypothetical protein